MPHGKARLTALGQQGHHILRHIGEHQLAALAQEPCRLLQGTGHIPADVEAALAEDAVKESLLPRRGQEIAPGDILPSGFQIDALGKVARIPEQAHGTAVTGAHVQPFCARLQKGQFDQIAAVLLTARMAQHHLSSSAFSTESTLPNASSSGT